VSKIKTVKDNTSWIITDDKDKTKVGSIVKHSTNEYAVQFRGTGKIFSKTDLIKSFGSQLFREDRPKLIEKDNTNTVYDHQTDCKPFNPMWYVKLKLPLYTKEQKSKSFYCAGYYLISKKGWQEEYCPKLITLEKYKFHGPFFTIYQMKAFQRKYL
jgi:hypothetical protein